jgi:hypothetical protein
LEKTALVAMREETFKTYMEGVYPVPSTYPRASKKFKFLAAYRKAPISAITHVARVKKREKTRNPSGHIEDLLRGDHDELTVFHLEDPKEIDPVENDVSGVRGTWYTSLQEIRDAEKLSDLTEK